jgi:hypothetical protein
MNYIDYLRYLLIHAWAFFLWVPYIVIMGASSKVFSWSMKFTFQAWYGNKTRTFSIGIFDTLKIVKNKLELRKLQPFLVKKVKNTKKQTTEYYKTSSWSPKKFLVCCSITIKIQRQIVKLKVMLP